MAALNRILLAKRRLPPPDERRRLRENAGFSVRSFANALGISPSTLARWEIGEREPRGPMLFIYVDGLRALVREEEQNANK
jgi:DNA-binding transcriptional regulator YiaG